MSRSRILGILLIVVLGGLVAAGAWVARQKGLWGSGDAGARPGEPVVEYYTCSMHPFLREPEPGNCPICQMKLEPVYKGASSAETGVISISLEEERSLGIRTAVVTRARVGEPIRTVGRVEVNEERLAHVHTRFEGWVEELFVNADGQPVRRGEPLFSIYAPEVLASQEEYLVALRARDALGAQASSESRRQAETLLEAARDRLRLWEIPEEAVSRLEQTRKAERTVVLRSPAAGFVRNRNVTRGQQVMPGMDLYVIADLANPWLVADVYEADQGRIRVGQRAEATFGGLPGRRFEGVVEYVYPVLDELSRTVRVRIALSSASGELRPGMFGDVTLDAGGSETRLVVPADAVMTTGSRSIVFVRRGEGLFEPRQVKTGVWTADRVEILEGLVEGDVVVERGQFFLDAEARLRLPPGAAMPGETAAATTPSARTEAGASSAPSAPSSGPGHAGHAH